MNKRNYFENTNKDKTYRTLFSFFPLKFYEKFKKIIISFIVIFLIITVVYLIVASYLQNDMAWYCLIIPIFLLIFGSLLLTQININLCIKKFKQQYYSNQKELLNKDQIIVINKRKLFNKRTKFIDQLIQQVYEQIK